MLRLPPEGWEVRHGDALQVLPELPGMSVDAVVTDAPYGLEFMGKEWDGADGFRRSLNRADVGRRNVFGRTSRTSPEYRGRLLFQEWCYSWAVELLRVLKPGAHALVFGGTRTYHRMACALEDAGFEIRDSLHWFHGTGFPKSLDLEEGRGTALKPGHEPIVLARRPLEGRARENLVRWGTGALDIDASRSPIGDDRSRKASGRKGIAAYGDSGLYDSESHPLGRWPSNVLLDETTAAKLDEAVGERLGGIWPRRRVAPIGYSGKSKGQEDVPPARDADRGGPSRFFYVAKAARWERDFGLQEAGFPLRSGGEATERRNRTKGLRNPRAGAGRNGRVYNVHPTVKPIALMRHLVRLVTPPQGLVLDPFTGSGTTGIAAMLEGKGFLGLELLKDHVQLARARVRAWYRAALVGKLPARAR